MRGRTRETFREKRGPEKHVAELGDLKFRLGEKTRLPHKRRTCHVISDNDPDLLKVPWKKRIEELEIKARQGRRGADKCRKSRPDARLVVK